MYDHTKQYRCTIIRGKSQKEMDDLLPAYAKVIDEICPCKANDFEKMFNNEFESYLPKHDRTKKTLDNHRTEISGKLFGMYYLAADGMIYESERTQKFLADNDQPAFFKDVCYKMQFPNGMQKIATTVRQRIKDKICINANAFLLKFLQIARTAGVDISKSDIGYYILNALDVLQGNANPYEVLEVVVADKKVGIQRKVSTPGKASSYSNQHINEQLNYLELANLIRIKDNKIVILNPKEDETICLFAEKWDKKPSFNMYNYDVDSAESRKKMQLEWDLYFSKISTEADKFSTSAAALIVEEAVSDKHRDDNKRFNLTEFGDEGESVVYEYEKKRVAKYSQRLANKVLSLGKTKGLGYDIQSVIAEPGENDEFVKYIEVKSTKRYTCPDINDTLWIDTLNITRNEWIAANQHGEFYSIYRVYFTQNGITIFILANVAKKFNDVRMKAIPMTYRVDFKNICVDEVVDLNISEVSDNV